MSRRLTASISAAELKYLLSTGDFILLLLLALITNVFFPEQVQCTTSLAL